MKMFSVEEANALLPAVRRIVTAISRAHTTIISFQEASRRAAAGAESGGGHMPEGMKYVMTLLNLVQHTNELEELGVQLKDYERGLIDFPAMRDGRIVLLCWKLDEGDQIEWWHEVEAGFAGRQPL